MQDHHRQFDEIFLQRTAGPYIGVMTAGACGAVQSGTYNTRALVPEVLVKDDQYAVVRPRVEVDELIAMDKPAPWL
jgi:diaminopimelate decarboxylase